MEVSVVVPMLNEENNIERCLDSILRQSFEKSEYEIIVVDNGSVDRSVKLASKYDAKLLIVPGDFIGAVRNRGVSNASGKIIAFIDADCEAPPDWLKSGVNELDRSNEIGCVGGRCLSPKSGTLIERLWAPWEEGSVSQFVFVDHMATGTCFIRKSLIEKIGGFNENIKTGEDTDLTFRIRRAGHLIGLSNACDVVHFGYPKDSLSFFLRQYNQGASYIYKVHSMRDYTFYSVIIFFVSFLISFILFLFGFEFFYYPLFLCFFLVFIYSYYRGYVKRSDLKIVHFFGCYFINLLYFLGRSFGLSASILCRVIGRKVI